VGASLVPLSVPSLSSSPWTEDDEIRDEIDDLRVLVLLAFDEVFAFDKFPERPVPVLPLLRLRWMVVVLSLLLVVDLVPKVFFDPALPVDAPTVADEDDPIVLVFFMPFFRLALLFAAAAVLDGPPLVAAATFFDGLVAALVAPNLLRFPKTIAALLFGANQEERSAQAHARHSTVVTLRYG